MPLESVASQSAGCATVIIDLGVLGSGKGQIDKKLIINMIHKAIAVATVRNSARMKFECGTL